MNKTCRQSQPKTVVYSACKLAFNENFGRSGAVTRHGKKRTNLTFGRTIRVLEKAKIYFPAKKLRLSKPAQIPRKASIFCIQWVNFPPSTFIVYNTFLHLQGRRSVFFVKKGIFLEFFWRLRPQWRFFAQVRSVGNLPTKWESAKSPFGISAIPPPPFRYTTALSGSSWLEEISLPSFAPK